MNIEGRADPHVSGRLRTSLASPISPAPLLRLGVPPNTPPRSHRASIYRPWASAQVSAGPQAPRTTLFRSESLKCRRPLRYICASKEHRRLNVLVLSVAEQ